MLKSVREDGDSRPAGAGGDGGRRQAEQAPLRQWPQVLAASVGLVRHGFGMDWYRTLHGAWLVLRANQLWAPLPGNDPEGARRCMRRFYALVKLSYGEPSNPAEAARLEVDWWRAHRENQYSTGPRGAVDELVESVTRLYAYLYREPADAVRPAAAHRARAMDLSDQWIEEGCDPASPLLPREHEALVRCYAALLAAVHHTGLSGPAGERHHVPVRVQAVRSPITPVPQRER